MRRAHDITDQELRDFTEWFVQRFRVKKTRREWFATSMEGRFHVPARDLKDLAKRLEALALVKVSKDFVELAKV